jgi:ATP-binding cassette subfamily C (CFTR/MRP) protein 1
VDSETASVMQEIVDSDFHDTTVIAVMHQLRHVSRYDKVAVIGVGMLLEYGEPELLLNGDTQFAELYKMHGK